MIRSAAPADLDTLMDLWLAGNLDAHPFVSPDYWLSHFSEVRAALPEAELFVWAPDGAVRGFAGLTGTYLAGIFVHRAFRSKGGGKALLDHIKARGLPFTLHVYEENRRAAAFYQREGLHVTTRGTDPGTGLEELTMAWAP